MRPRRALVGLLLLAFACTPTSRLRPEAAEAAPAAEPATFTPAAPIFGESVLDASSDASPVAVKLLGVRVGKPPLRFFYVRLTLTNRREHPVWLLFPYWIDDPLPATPVFTADRSLGAPFVGKGHGGEGGQAVEVALLGNPGFRVFHLPPRGRVVFDAYSFEGWKDVTSVDVWEVAALKVNGVRALERWLPYTTLSDPDVHVGMDAPQWTNLDWDRERGGSRVDYPDEPVREVTAEILQRRRITLPVAEAL